jgi:DNA-binding CsgD family transcriptional regulator
VIALTDRERQIVDLVGDGLTNTQVGERLHLSHYTVKSHLARIFRKMDATSRTQLVMLVNAERIRTGPEIAELLTRMRADMAASWPPFGTSAWFRHEGSVAVLDALINQLGSLPPAKPPRMRAGADR